MTVIVKTIVSFDPVKEAAAAAIFRAKFPDWECSETSMATSFQNTTYNTAKIGINKAEGSRNDEG